jgi:hypothetical protein
MTPGARKTQHRCFGCGFGMRVPPILRRRLSIKQTSVNCAACGKRRAPTALMPAGSSRWRNQSTGSTHRDYVIFKCRAAKKADLIIAAVPAAVRPREAMRAEQSQKLSEEGRHNWPRKLNIARECVLVLKWRQRLQGETTTEALYRGQYGSSPVLRKRPLPVFRTAMVLAISPIHTGMNQTKRNPCEPNPRKGQLFLVQPPAFRRQLKFVLRCN